MIISDARKYIFVHIPKTAGTALALALEDMAAKDDILIGDTPKAIRRRRRLKGVKTQGRLWKHSTLRDVYGLVDQTQMETYFVFTLVRNPWDRLVSYYHWLQEQRFDHYAVRAARKLEFSRFLHDPVVAASLIGNPYQSYVIDRDEKNCCDLFVRMEHLARDLLPLEAHLGKKIGPLQRINSSTRDRDYRRYYADENAEWVARLCAADIARFGYRFDG